MQRGATGVGVIQRSALDGRYGPYAPAVVRADHRIRSDAGFRPAIASATIRCPASAGASPRISYSIAEVGRCSRD
jgi:hypothetical protein